MASSVLSYVLPNANRTLAFTLKQGPTSQTYSGVVGRRESIALGKCTSDPNLRFSHYRRDDQKMKGIQHREKKPRHEVEASYLQSVTDCGSEPPGTSGIGTSGQLKLQHQIHTARVDELEEQFRTTSTQERI